MIMIIAIICFTFSSWAVFSHKFDDGIVAKHLLSLSAIISFLSIIDRDNYKAAAVASGLLVLGIGYGLYKHRRLPLTMDRKRHF